MQKGICPLPKKCIRWNLGMELAVEISWKPSCAGGPHGCLGAYESAKEPLMKGTRAFILTCLLLTGLMFAAGCCGTCRVFGRGNSDKTGVKKLCDKCGQEKGSAACCKPDAEKCAMCGKDKGSPGCCK